MLVPAGGVPEIGKLTVTGCEKVMAGRNSSTGESAPGGGVPPTTLTVTATSEGTEPGGNCTTTPPARVIVPPAVAVTVPLALGARQAPSAQTWPPLQLLPSLASR